MSLVTFAAVVTAGFGIGCSYEPTVPEGAVRCDEAQRCPAGTLCTAVRDRAAVLLVCCRNPGCEGRTATTRASIVNPSLKTSDQTSESSADEGTQLAPEPDDDSQAQDPGAPLYPEGTSPPVTPNP
jgi:hypothetical protein